jgi:hypothetical protein
VQKYAQKNVMLFYLKQFVKTNNQEIVMEGEQYSDTYGLNATKEEKTGSSYAVHRDKNLLTPTSEPVSAYKVMDLIYFTQEDKKYW